MTLKASADVEDTMIPAQRLKLAKPAKPDKAEKPAKPGKPAAPVLSLKERQRQEREQLSLSAAQELLLERGYHEMSIDEIAERVGISKGTVYLHFESKEDLVLALLHRGMQEFARALDVALSGPTTPREKLRAVLELFYSGISSTHAQVASAAFQDPALLRRMAEHRQRVSDVWDGPRKRIAAVIDEGKAAGEFDREMPTPLLLSLFRCLLSPHDYQRLVVEEGLPREEVLRAVTTFYFRGITPESSSDRFANREAESPDGAGAGPARQSGTTGQNGVNPA